MSALRTLIAHARLLRPRSARSSSLVEMGTASRSHARFSRARLAQLRQIIGAPDDGLLPPIALQLLASPLHLELLADPRFPLSALGLVHVANTIDEHRALPDGLAVDLSAFITELVSTARGEQFTLVTEAHVDGALVYRAMTTALQKAKKSGARSERREVRAEPERELLERTIVGVPEPTGRRYAHVAGDLNPIHQRAWLARPFGFPRAVVHGTWTLSRALELARDVRPRWPRRIECTFRQPVLLPSTIAVEVCRSPSGLHLRVTSPDDAAREHLRAEVRPLA